VTHHTSLFYMMHALVLLCINQHRKFEVPLTTPLSGMICRPRSRTCTINLPIKFEVSISTHYEDTKIDTKCGKWGGLGYVRVTEMAPFDRTHTSSH